MDISFDLIKIFINVAKHQSFSKTARQLNMTQSAISQSIARLENQLDIKLFTRSNGKIQLTEQGLLLYEEASLGERSFLLGISKALNFTPSNAKNLNIKSSSSYFKTFLNPIINNIIASYPNLHINMKRNLHDYNSQESLLNGTLDICITDKIDEFDNSNLKITQIAEMPIEFLYNPKLFDYKTNNHIDFLKRNKIAVNYRSKFHEPYIKFLKDNNISISAEFPHDDMIIDFIMKNKFIGLAPKKLDYLNQLNSLTITSIPTKHVNVYAITHKDNLVANEILAYLTMN